jgi:hypothetical protein
MKDHHLYKKKNKQTLWLWVRKRNIPTDLPPLVGEVFTSKMGIALSAQWVLTAVYLGFLNRSHYFSFK